MRLSLHAEDNTLQLSLYMNVTRIIKFLMGQTSRNINHVERLLHMLTIRRHCDERKIALKLDMKMQCDKNF